MRTPRTAENFFRSQVSFGRVAISSSTKRVPSNGLGNISDFPHQGASGALSGLILHNTAFIVIVEFIEPS